MAVVVAVVMRILLLVYLDPPLLHLPAVVGEQVGEQEIPEAERVTPATQALRQPSTVLPYQRDAIRLL